MQFISQIRIDGQMVDWLEEHLKGRKMFEYYDSDSVIHRETVKFIDGIEMDIKVCNAETSEGGAWSEGVLFDENGNEIGCTEVGESVLGEFSVEYNGDKYTVMVGRFG